MMGDTIEREIVREAVGCGAMFLHTNDFNPGTAREVEAGVEMAVRHAIRLGFFPEGERARSKVVADMKREAAEAEKAQREAEKAQLLEKINRLKSGDGE